MSQAVTTTENPAARQSWWSVLGWAAYLACSWTWCIGMFLPVLLVRDYGVWGFVVFAVPNVIGAGAMGWVLRNGASERISARHRAAIGWFSAVTIAFQVFFLVFAAAPVAMGNSSWPLGSMPLVALASVAIGCVLGAGCRGAMVAWLVSMALLVCAWRQGLVDYRGIEFRSTPGLAWLAPVCVFGFALCPYLDGTFLKVRHANGNTDARGAFSIGFGVLFFAMIIGTLGYAGFAAWWLLTRDAWGFIAGSLAALVPAHICMQIGFTVRAHGDELRAGKKFYALIGVIGAGALLGLLARQMSFQHAGMTLFELVYRCFMSFYGLVFPAYVWLCMIPTADGHSGIEGPRGRWKLMVLGAACTLAAPCYWMGFIERVEWWLAPGLGVVLAARLLVRGLAGATVNTST